MSTAATKPPHDDDDPFDNSTARPTRGATLRVPVGRQVPKKTTPPPPPPSRATKQTNGAATPRIPVSTTRAASPARTIPGRAASPARTPSSTSNGQGITRTQSGSTTTTLRIPATTSTPGRTSPGTSTTHLPKRTQSGSTVAAKTPTITSRAASPARTTATSRAASPARTTTTRAASPARTPSSTLDAQIPKRTQSGTTLTPKTLGSTTRATSPARTTTTRAASPARTTTTTTATSRAASPARTTTRASPARIPTTRTAPPARATTTVAAAAAATTTAAAATTTTAAAATTTTAAAATTTTAAAATITSATTTNTRATSPSTPDAPSMKQTQSGSTTYRPPAPRGQAINRLSRVFEDTANGTTIITTTTTTNNTITSIVSSPPASPPLISPTTIAVSPTAARPPRAPTSPSVATFPSRPRADSTEERARAVVRSARSNKLQEKDVKEKETREQEVKERGGWQDEELDGNGIDQSQVAFKDLKAKFQKKADNDLGSIRTLATVTTKRRPSLNVQLPSSPTQTSDTRSKQSVLPPLPSPLSASSHSTSTSPTNSTIFSFSRGNHGVGTGTNTATTSIFDSMSEPADDGSMASDPDEDGSTHGHGYVSGSGYGYEVEERERGRERERDSSSSSSVAGVLPSNARPAMPAAFALMHQRPPIPAGIFQQRQRVSPPIPKKALAPNSQQDQSLNVTKDLGIGKIRPQILTRSSASASLEIGEVTRRGSAGDESLQDVNENDVDGEAEFSFKLPDFATKKANVAGMLHRSSTTSSIDSVSSTLQLGKPLPPIPTITTTTTTTTTMADLAPYSAPSTPSSELSHPRTNTMSSRLGFARTTAPNRRPPRPPMGRRGSGALGSDIDDPAAAAISSSPPSGSSYFNAKTISTSPPTARVPASPAASLRLPHFSPFPTTTSNGTFTGTFNGGAKRTRATISTIFGRNATEDESSTPWQASADEVEPIGPAPDIELPPPRTPSPPPDPVEVERKRREKRRNVVRELIETEIGYEADMRLLYDVYYVQATESFIFDKHDLRIIFSNLMQVVEFSAGFVELLERAAIGPEKGVMRAYGDEDDEDDEYDVLVREVSEKMGKGSSKVKMAENENSTWIGKAFSDVMSQMEEIYCDYVKRHESSVLKLQEMDSNKEIQAFLKKCHEQVQGKTNSWDVFSLLVKPVQRVLKYPLLLELILSLTSPEHPDYSYLKEAAFEIQQVADRINEIKRRKDIVEKIVGDRKRTDVNVVHGINKTITRRAQKFKQVTGMGDITIDIFYDALCLRFNEQQEAARQLARDIQVWLRSMREYFDVAETFAYTLKDLYSMGPSAEKKSLQWAHDFCKCLCGFVNSCGRELDIQSRTVIYPAIESFLEVFKNPAQVMRKREKKLLDYDRVRGIKARGDVPDKALQESADAYVSINAQLVEELPKFFALTISYFDIIVQELSVIQARFYQQMADELCKYMYQELSAMDAQTANVVEEYWETVEQSGGVENLVKMMDMLSKKIIPGSGASTPSGSEISGFGSPGLTRKGSHNGNLSLGVDFDTFRKGGTSPLPARSLSGATRNDSGHRSPLPFTFSRKSPHKQNYSDTGSNQPISFFDLDPTRGSDSGAHHSALASTAMRSNSVSVRQRRDNPGLSGDRDRDSVSARSSNSTFSGDDDYSVMGAGTSGADEPLFRCVALSAYYATRENELPFGREAVMDVWYCEGEGENAQWYGERVDDGSSTYGWFPASYCKKIR